MTSSMFETLDILETFNVETEYTAAVNDDDAELVDTVQVHELTLNKVSCNSQIDFIVLVLFSWANTIKTLLEHDLG